MRTNWQRLDNGDWGVKVQSGPGQATGQEGREVDVTARSGRIKTVTLGRQVRQWNGGRSAVYEKAPEYDDRSYKERTGRCEDAPCCGCCGGWQEAESSYFTIYG